MKLELSSEWYEREFHIEATSPAMSITAGAACLKQLTPTPGEGQPVSQSHAVPSFGRLINFARRNLELTRAQLSRDAGVEQQVLVKLEHDEDYPDARTIRSLSSALSLPASKLITMYNLTPVEGMYVREEARYYDDALDVCEELSADEKAALEEFLDLVKEP
jgi:transcriptional regulator with XRE-family HTH domain